MVEMIGLFLRLPFEFSGPRADHAPMIVYIVLGLIIAVIVVALRLTMSIGEGASPDTVLLRYPPDYRWTDGFGPSGGFTRF